LFLRPSHDDGCTYAKSVALPSSYLDVGQLSRPFSSFEIEADRQFTTSIVFRFVRIRNCIAGTRGGRRRQRSGETGTRPPLAP
jgi:hypothetical protein